MPHRGCGIAACRSPKYGRAVFPPPRVGGPQYRVPLELSRGHLAYPCRRGGVDGLLLAGRPQQLLAALEQFRRLLEGAGCRGRLLLLHSEYGVVPTEIKYPKYYCGFMVGGKFGVLCVCFICAGAARLKHDT